MPQVTVYVRQDDLEKWKAVEKKSEFIHNALQWQISKGGSPKPKLDVPSVPRTGSVTLEKELKPSIVEANYTRSQKRQVLKQPVFKPKGPPLNKEEKSYAFCKHSQVRGFCKYGCK